MRKSILGAMIGCAFALGSAHAGLIVDLNGSAAGGQITADSLDWAPTSFLAKGGNTAIGAFLLSGGACTTSCQFDVLTQAKLTGYKPTGSSQFIGLPAAGGEITMVARYTEQVVAASPGTFASATFQSTGAGFVEFYYSAAADSTDVSGFGFNNGTLIGRLSGVVANVLGSFTIDGRVAPVPLDGTNGGTTNLYTGQQTVTGSGSQGALGAGTTSVALDPTFFLTSLAGFALNFENISIGLPYGTVHPADCFVPNPAAAAVGTTGLVSSCNDVHDNTTYAGQTGTPATGYLPVVGGVNGLGQSSPDFVAQTDFNSAVAGAAVPEPGSLALVGLALGALGFAARRRR